MHISDFFYILAILLSTLNEVKFESLLGNKHTVTEMQSSKVVEVAANMYNYWLICCC